MIRVTFKDDITSVDEEEYIAMLAQNAMVHRILPLNNTI